MMTLIKTTFIALNNIINNKQIINMTAGSRQLPTATSIQYRAH